MRHTHEAQQTCVSFHLMFLMKHFFYETLFETLTLMRHSLLRDTHETQQTCFSLHLMFLPLLMNHEYVPTSYVTHKVVFAHDSSPYTFTWSSSILPPALFNNYSLIFPKDSTVHNHLHLLPLAMIYHRVLQSVVAFCSVIQGVDPVGYDAHLLW